MQPLLLRTPHGAWRLDADGKFALAVPQNAVLIITATGYKTQTIKAENVADLQIKLAEDVARLDEVVITGLSTSVKRRKNLANAVSTIVLQKELNCTAPAETFDAALEVVKIRALTLMPTQVLRAEGISVKLRGVRSVYGNTQPLYVVDGVFVDNLLPPAD